MGLGLGLGLENNERSKKIKPLMATGFDCSFRENSNRMDVGTCINRARV